MATGALAAEFAPVALETRDGLAFVRIDNPPVNGLSLAVRRGLLAAFERIRGDDQIGAVVLHGAGRGFSAGGDIREFGTPDATAAPGLSLDIHPAIERCGKPVVAALHGFAVGGGLETALACHYRVAEAPLRIALPEGKLGVIPLSGTQRLPRLIGLSSALDLILSGATLRAEDVFDSLLFDLVVAEGEALEAACGLAREAAASAESHGLVRDLPPPPLDPSVPPRRAELAAAGASRATLGLFDAVMASAEEASFEDGMARARAIYDALISSDDVREARDAFFARSEQQH